MSVLLCKFTCEIVAIAYASGNDSPLRLINLITRTSVRSYFHASKTASFDSLFISQCNGIHFNTNHKRL